MTWANSPKKKLVHLKLFVLKFLFGLSASHWTKDEKKKYSLSLVRWSSSMSVISSFLGVFFGHETFRTVLTFFICWSMYLIDEIYLTPVTIWRPLPFLFAVPKTVCLDPSTFMASDKIGHHASQTTSRQSRLKGVHSGSPTHDALWNYKPPEGRRPIKVAYLCAGVHLWKYFTAHLCDNDPLGQTRVGLGVF